MLCMQLGLQLTYRRVLGGGRRVQIVGLKWLPLRAFLPKQVVRARLAGRTGLPFWAATGAAIKQVVVAQVNLPLHGWCFMGDVGQAGRAGNVSAPFFDNLVEASQRIRKSEHL